MATLLPQHEPVVMDMDAELLQARDRYNEVEQQLNAARQRLNKAKDRRDEANARLSDAEKVLADARSACAKEPNASNKKAVQDAEAAVAELTEKVAKEVAAVAGERLDVQMELETFKIVDGRLKTLEAKRDNAQANHRNSERPRQQGEPISPSSVLNISKLAHGFVSYVLSHVWGSTSSPPSSPLPATRTSMPTASVPSDPLPVRSEAPHSNMSPLSLSGANHLQSSMPELDASSQLRERRKMNMKPTTDNNVQDP